MEYIVYKGNKYKRTKEGYYLRTERLHRRIWEDNFGQIPEKHHIHHKNGVKDDNRIENLECISEVDHPQHHFDWEKHIKILHSENSRAKSRAWFKTKKAKKLIGSNTKRAWKNRKPIERVCTICNLKFYTRNYAGTKYCSQKCRELSGYRSSKSKRNCVLCGREFVSQRGKACSRQCGANLAAKNRRENKQSDIISAIK